MSAKHWKKRFTGVDPLDFSPGLLRIQAQPPTPFARALLDLKAQHLIADGVRHSLAPGMQVIAEIHLGTRTICYRRCSGRFRKRGGSGDE